MAAKEFLSDQEAGDEETTLMQVDPYEEEETLSLCDLPIYSGSNSAQWGDDFSKEDGCDDDKNDNMFEFFSEEFSTSSNNNSATAENIIFCGKLIPFKDIHIPPRVETERSNIVQKDSSSSTNGALVLPWRPMKRSAKRSWKNEGLGGKGSKSFACDYTSNGKVSLWSSTEMELGDIRNRQSRRGPARMFPAAEDTEGKRRCRGMWKLLKSISLVLGCRNSEIANDVVKAAFV
ncbi:hypothetical protein CR513_20294, partial [Mucuna pruriens]